MYVGEKEKRPTRPPFAQCGWPKLGEEKKH